MLYEAYDTVIISGINCLCDIIYFQTVLCFILKLYFMLSAINVEIFIFVSFLQVFKYMDFDIEITDNYSRIIVNKYSL